MRNPESALSTEAVPWRRRVRTSESAGSSSWRVCRRFGEKEIWYLKEPVPVAATLRREKPCNPHWPVTRTPIIYF